MAKNFQDFYNEVIGHAYDIDGSYGAQCWDGYAKYCQWLGIQIVYCTVTGGVRDILEQSSWNGVLKSCSIVSSPQNGDIGVWTNEGGGYGHVAMYYNGGWLGQNQGGTPYPYGGSAFNVINLYMPTGLLRPGGVDPSPTPGPEPEPEPGKLYLDIINGIVVGARIERS